ncbi:type II toxin-antitoxin system Phd/YefM family antitoxin [Amycolatopsis pithecellobii]|uniref:Antitoxin n=1 Tax=Amycolatopsis pithecellobii TaxID=664692 RepID=A0A6N7Z4Y2_9PSEU|nr:type II toxin-antitoxin system prevent-host-death family antitoxin [Amycolatopsis pithecellobii]MTD55514.1 type II toxin-antitoxin system prevent-host-death family antitoxin [Amycolatopsis pithecellobii]
MTVLPEVSVGLRELRHHTSEVIARVRRGETIEVTEHGTPVARLVPIARPERPAILARLDAEGRLRAAKNAGYVPDRLHPVAGGDPSPLTGALLAERESERW